MWIVMGEGIGNSNSPIISNVIAITNLMASSETDIASSFTEVGFSGTIMNRAKVRIDETPKQKEDQG